MMGTLFVWLMIASISSLSEARGRARGPPVCIKRGIGTNCTMLHWRDFMKNISRFSLTNAEIYFSPGSVYNLSKKNLTIKNAKNVALVGNCTGECFAMINCTVKSMLIIANSTSLTLKNILFNGCGDKSMKVLFGKNVLPNTTAAAIVLYNVSTATVLKCKFLNSYGHGILGFAVEKNLTIMKVKFIHNITSIGLVHVFQGGVLLYNNIDNYAVNIFNLLISHCYFRGIQNNWNNLKSNSGVKIKHEDVNSAAIGVVSYQHNVTIKIEILHTIVTNIKSKHGALINSYFSVNSRCSIHISNCNFSNNTADNTSIVNIHDHLSTVNSSLKDHYYFDFKITASVFQSNIAYNTVINVTVNGNRQTILFRNIEMYGNKIGGALVYACTTNSNFSICNCTVDSNTVVNGSGLVLAGVTDSMFLGQNAFHNNTVLNGNVIVLNQTVSSFKGNTKFSFNQASGILSLHNYTTLLDGATISLTNNFNTVSNDSALISVTVESHVYYNPCAFQLRFSNSTMHDKLDSIATSITEEDNRGYKYIMYGSR